MFNLIHAAIFSAFDAPFELDNDSETAVASNTLGIAELYTCAISSGKFAVRFVFDDGSANEEGLLIRYVLGEFDSHADAKAFMLEFIANHNARTGHDAGSRYDED